MDREDVIWMDPGGSVLVVRKQNEDPGDILNLCIKLSQSQTDPRASTWLAKL